MSRRGVAAGRLVYQPYIDRIGARNDISVPFALLGITAAALVLLANAVAVGSARRAASTVPLGSSPTSDRSLRGVPRRLAGVPIRVVLAEDNTLLREGMARLLERADDIELVGSAVDRPTLEALVEATSPDLVITDIRMPPTGTDEGIQIASHLRKERPGVGVVVLSQYVDAAYALALLDGGSEGRAYLLKERVSDVDELLHAIREVAAGGSVIDSKVVESLVSTKRPQTSDVDRLTPREREILGEMAQGKSNAAIAASLVLSTRAVEKHTNSIFSKLGLSEEIDVNRRVKAVLLYLAAG